MQGWFAGQFEEPVVWVDLAENDRTVIAVVLLETVDGRIPDCWEARNNPDAPLTLWSRHFYTADFRKG